jgi:hypothetical protein
MPSRLAVLAVCVFPAALALPYGVYWTAMGIEDTIDPDISDSSRLRLGLPLLIFGLLVGELFWRAIVRLRTDPQELDRLAKGDERERKGLEEVLRIVPGLLTASLILIQFIALMQFFFVLDMHVRFRACAGIYAVYAAGVMLLVGVRWKQWTYAERLYVRWAWAVMIAVGVPLVVPTIRKMGVVGPLL